MNSRGERIRKPLWGVDLVVVADPDRELLEDGSSIGFGMNAG
jgi:hypothetical protein